MKKFSKKALAWLLSVMIVMSALPFTAITAFAAGDENSSLLYTAIGNYERKMQDIATIGKIYTNMKPAYEKYVEANRLINEYDYGNVAVTKSTMDTVAGELNSLSNNMVEFNPVQGAYKDVFGDKDSNSGNIKTADYYNNVLYAQKNPGEDAHGDVANVKRWTIIPNAVFLYDGALNPTLPIMAAAQVSANKQRYVYGIYPTSATAGTSANTGHPDVACTMPWKGNNGTTAHWAWCVASDAGNTAYSWGGGWAGAVKDDGLGKQSTSTRSEKIPTGTTSSAKKKVYYAGLMSINTESFSFPANTYSKSSKPYWFFGSGDSPNSVADQTVKQQSATFYFINYKPIREAVTNAGYRDKLDEVTEYKQGGLLTLVDAMDACSSLDLHTGSNGSWYASNTATQVSTVAGNISSAVGKVNAISISEDNHYDNLKKAMIDPTKEYNQTAKKKFVTGNANNENYTAESWAPFAKYYGAAQSMFAALANGGSYVATFTVDGEVLTPNQLAQKISEAEAGLDINRNVVDTSSIDVLLDNAYMIVANKNMFDSASYSSSGIESMVINCITDIYTAYESYGDDTVKILDSAQARQTVASYITPLANAIRANKLNYDSVLASMNYSMNSAITEAESYRPTKDDYANYDADVVPALNNAYTMQEDFTGYVLDPHVPGQIRSLTNNYVTYVQAIIKAVRGLRPAFDKITNGTRATQGVEDTLSYSMNGDRWKFRWTRSNGAIYFKTERDAVDWKLPVNYFEWQTSEKYDAMLDALNLASDPSLVSEELTAKSCAVIGNTMPKDYGLNQAQMDSHPGGMSIMNANITLAFDNVKVTTSSATVFAHGMDGSNISDKNTDLTELLLTTEGAEGTLKGGIIANKGTTQFGAVAHVQVPATTGSLTRATTPSNKSKAFDAGAANGHFGILYYYKYDPFLRWVGYSYEQSTYQQRIYVVDLVTLFELIQQAQNMTSRANEFTKTSWDRMMGKLAAAKGEMDYGNMTYDEIVSACDTRYTELWDAMQINQPGGLQYPASNANLKAIIEECRSIYENDESKCKPSSWTTFETAYRNALGALQGDYSDTGIRDYAVDDEVVLANIAKLVSDLSAAKDGLAYRINFAPVDNAADALVKAIATRTYTLDSLNAVKSALEGMSNLNMSAADRFNHYDDEKDLVAAVANEATNLIPNLSSLLVPVKNDNQLLSAVELLDYAKADTLSKYQDPDAYDIENIQFMLGLLTPYQAVEIKDYLNANSSYSIEGAKYSTKEEAEYACAQVLSGVQIQQYTVTRENYDGTTTVIGSYPYGTEITVSAKEENGSAPDVEWYYSFNSNVSSCAEKLFSTGSSDVTFVVKGNTTLRTKKATSTDLNRVSFVNALNGKIYDVMYVESNEVINLATAQMSVPKLAYFSFSDFTANAKIENNKITVTRETVIYANYDVYTGDTYKVTAFNLSGWGPVVLGNTTATEVGDATGYGYVGAGVKYNDRVSFTADNYYNYDGYAPDDDYYDTFIFEVNHTPQYFNTGSRYQDEVAGWIKLDISDTGMTYDEALDALANCVFTSVSEVKTKAPGIKAEIVSYGPDYTFYAHEDCMLVALTADELSALTADEDFIEKDYTIDVVTPENIRTNDDASFSIVGTYCVPEGATIVENGVLFVASKKNIDLSLSLANASANSKIHRIKSTLHTVANQYVITINIAAKGTYNVKYCGYITYKIGNQTVTVYSVVQDGSYTVA